MRYSVHPLADVQTKLIGENSRIWQFVVILPNARIGDDVNICSHCFIENNVIIGDRVTVKSGVQLWDGLRVGNDVFIGPNASFTNDRFPRSRQKPEKFLETTIQDSATIGAGAIILPGLTIGSKAMVAAGAVVTRSVPSNAIVEGNPARIVGYVNVELERNIKHYSVKDDRQPPYSNITVVRGVTIHKFPLIPDLRGSLTVGEFEQHIPFVPKRYFMVFDVPSKETRGEHAHRACHQFLVCIRGSCAVMGDDGENRIEVSLDSPDKGIYLPPMIWGVQYKYSEDAMLLVFASHHYDANDYIRDYSKYIQMIKHK